MRNDRKSKTTRGLSVVAGSSLLVLSAVGSVSAHSAAPNGRVVGADGDTLRLRIMRMEPDLDATEVDDLVEAVQEAMDASDDNATEVEDAVDEGDGEHASPIGDRSSDDRQAEDADEHDGAQNDGEHEDADENDGEHEDADQEDAGDHEDGDQGGGDHEGGDTGGD